MTNEEALERQQAQYRKNCTMRRRGKIIEQRTAEENWVTHQKYPSINAAKRASRRLPTKTLYTEKKQEA